ncbi:MAG TPA: fumarylacetoacetate hydrolase family protein [Thermoanaerobaculia bacterium]|nr:fumarylacetoacetate hydrolase family protein [Thermoanaerobaculia bacterium]
MLLYRLAPEGFYAAGHGPEALRLLLSDPWSTLAGEWEWGSEVPPQAVRPLVPVLPGKIVGVGRNYRQHAAELGNPMPQEPLLFLKAPSAVIGPGEPIVLPPESEQVDFEGELALVVGATLRRAEPAAARAGLFGVCCACDVTARDLQRRDRTFARAKSFDSFCPLGPAIRLGDEVAGLEVVTRVDGRERQRGRVADMAWAPVELLSYVSRFITLEPGDVVLTGTPAGVGPLTDGATLEVEVAGVGVLRHRVESWRR